MLAEIAYPWTLQWFDSQHNFVGSQDQLIDGYPASPEGQTAMMEAIVQRVLDLPEQAGIGVCYWSPELWAIPEYPTAWENLAIFDDKGEVLPAASALNPFFSVGMEVEAPHPTPSLLDIYPNPIRQGQSLTGTDPGPGTVQIFDALGRHAGTAAVSSEPWQLDTSHLAPGLYRISLHGVDGRVIGGRIISILP